MKKPWPTTGPASHFPSIEKKYAKPIAEWKKLIRSQHSGVAHPRVGQGARVSYAAVACFPGAAGRKEEGGADPRDFQASLHGELREGQPREGEQHACEGA